MKIPIPKITSGYLGKYGAYLLSRYPHNSTTVVWIPGGGVSSFIFAYSGVGPYLIKNNQRVDNPIALPCSQLYIDVGGLGYSPDPYPTNDQTMVELYRKGILHFRLHKIILVGVSYGGKLAILLSQVLPKNMVTRVINFTPFYNPYYSMAYIPRPGERLGYYRLTPTDKLEYSLLKTEFQHSLQSGNHKPASKYLDSDGRFTRFTEQLLGISGPMNLWNIAKFQESTLGDWAVPRILQQIQQFLTHNPPRLSIEASPKSINKRLESTLGLSDYMMNSEGWNTLAWTEYSYLQSANLQNQMAPITTVSGSLDVITSEDGLLDWWRDKIGKSLVTYRQFTSSVVYHYQMRNRSGDDFYQVAGGGHLLVLTHPKETYDILLSYLSA
jgi:pimeloyl-ACP methyl ester carboxylesterase